ncbi:hypothetical protein LR48_Vigan07g072800 [Vigna angularis]|uniref:Uncharacterized protein n=1 Tax=Phaseolus angularis TaxID=3914 RepID=A0A0L9UWW6_PHAAN|nr:hypothetical protein LR48_Vigan07g072800 [Vigna angularis]
MMTAERHIKVADGGLKKAMEIHYLQVRRSRGMTFMWLAAVSGGRRRFRKVCGLRLWVESEDVLIV